MQVERDQRSTSSFSGRPQLNDARKKKWMQKTLFTPLFLFFFVAPCFAYDGDIHQQLTFIAARQFNDCELELPKGVSRFSALDTRYIVRSNIAQAETNVFVRMFRWNYYNRADRSSRSTLGLVDTRFHSHFEELVDEARWSDSKLKRLKNLGRIINYVQDVTSPARVVPVYTGRWWRFSVGDKFDRFALEPEQIAEAIDGICAEVFNSDASFHDVLEDAAGQTIRAVQAPIYGYPVSWEIFWEFGKDAESFGEYGPAGNSFGERTRFKCGVADPCLILKNDPLYRDFATARHITAVISTMRAMALMQLAEADRASMVEG